MPDLLSVLIADDDKIFRKIAFHNLQQQNHHVISAGNGKEAIELFDKYHPDLVLTDLRMPEIDGLEVIRHIRQYSRDIPVVVISGKGSIHDAIEALKHGAWDYLIKPIENIDVLIHTISKAREHINLLEENKQYQKNLEKKIEERTGKLKESEQKFRRLTETLPAGIFLYQDDKFVYSNEAAENITGYTKEELLSMNYWAFIHPDYQEKVRSIGKERQKQKFGIKKYDVKILTQTDEEKWLSLTTGSIEYKGRPAGIASAEDITERKLMERAIKMNQKNLSIRKKIAESFAISTEREVFKNVLHIILESFKSRYGYFGYISGDELVVPTMTEDIWDKCQMADKTNRFPKEKWSGLWGASLRKKQNLIKNDALEVPKGHVKLEKSMAAVILIKGELLGQIVLANKTGGYTEDDLHSITDLCHFISPLLVATMRQKEYLGNLIKAKEKAEESDRLKTTFLNNVSHEIRTPANGILGFAEILKAGDISSEERQGYVENINKSGRRMLNTIDSIIEISKIESREEKVSLADTNLNQLLDNVFLYFRNEAQQKSVALEIEKQLSDVEANIRTDSKKLYQVFENLVSNAIKFTKEGSVEFGYHKKDGEIEFFVSDTGIGVPEERHEAIFDRFVQADNKTTRNYQGTGLGLSISKAYVEMLGGQIWLDSKEDNGSTFYFTIPV